MTEWKTINTLPLDDGWSGRVLLGIMRSWGWEEWVGQVDDYDIWLGRDGEGACWETDKPTHWAPLPSPPETRDE